MPTGKLHTAGYVDFEPPEDPWIKNNAKLGSRKYTL